MYTVQYWLIIEGLWHLRFSLHVDIVLLINSHIIIIIIIIIIMYRTTERTA